jgi:hypothetical protein
MWFRRQGGAAALKEQAANRSLTIAVPFEVILVSLGRVVAACAP